MQYREIKVSKIWKESRLCLRGVLKGGIFKNGEEGRNK